LAAYVEKTMRWQKGPPVNPLKIKNKKIFYGTTRAKIFFHK
jgi:hypothetical protein